MEELSKRHIFITLFFILSSIHNSVANGKEEDAFYEGSGNTVQSGRWRNYTFVESENEGSRIEKPDRWRNYTFVESDYEGSRLPPTIAVIIIAANVGVTLCGCGSCIFVIYICFKKCRKPSTALNEEGNPYKETEMPTQVPPTASNANLSPGYAPVPTQKPGEKHPPVEPYGYPTDQKPIEKYQPPEPFGYPSGQQTYTTHAQPGFNAAQSGYNTAKSGYIPVQSGYGPAQPGYGPTQPGYGPAQPGNKSAQPGYILAQPVYNSGQPNI